MLSTSVTKDCDVEPSTRVVKVITDLIRGIDVHRIRKPLPCSYVTFEVHRLIHMSSRWAGELHPRRAGELHPRMSVSYGPNACHMQHAHLAQPGPA